ncbi:MAG TPA: class I SAM-dependent methyltransferase [Pyrinomonadaceae bacterium]|jgi:ubiquinone/menaquinone biosynthesis C-methylase UbiE
MESYTKFARFYDAVMGDQAGTARYIRKLIVQHKPEAQTLLELACGTGAVLVHLARDYEVAGLDRSSSMLAVARKRLPQVRLVHTDMRAFNLGQQFDVVLCVADSINHVLSFAGWRQVFRRVAAHLARGGLFIFDINTERKLKRHISEPPWVKPLDRNLLIMDVTDAGRGVSNWNIKVFAHQRGDNYKLFAEDIKEISFPADQIKQALLERFSVVKIIDRARRRPSNRSEQLFFICQR